MNEILLCRYGELILKGMNKYKFEKQMRKDLIRRLSRCGNFDVYAAQSVMYARPLDDTCDMDAAFDCAREVFGFVSISRAAMCEKNIGDMLRMAREYLPKHMASVASFKVEGKRADKNFPLTSPELASVVGGEIAQALPHLKVDLHNPEVVIRAEVREFGAYITSTTQRGAGGLPSGSAGRGMLLLSGGIDSPVAGYMMARRGCELHAIYFETPPYTGMRAREKVRELAEKMAHYTGAIRFHVVSLTQAQEAIAQHCDEQYFTVLLRRFMMRVAERVAIANSCACLITGESLGQVASQTMEALGTTDSVTLLPVFRPCIGMDKEEIIAISRKIDTYDTSCLPYDDCCSLFTPRHPKTRPELSKVEAEEAKLDVQNLVETSMKTIISQVVE